MPTWQDLQADKNIFQGGSFGQNDVNRAIAAGYSLNDINAFLKNTGVATDGAMFNQQSGPPTANNAASITDVMRTISGGSNQGGTLAIPPQGINSWAARTNGTNSFPANPNGSAGGVFQYSQYTGPGASAPITVNPPAQQQAPAPAAPTAPAPLPVDPAPATTPPPEPPPLLPADTGMSGLGISSDLTGGAKGFRRKESGARKKGLTNKGTGRLKIPLTSSSGNSSGLNIGA